MQLPLKSELFTVICNAGDAGLWENEAIDKMLSSEKVRNPDYWRDLARFWLMEMVGNGVIAIAEQKDDSDYYRKDAILSKYVPTELGLYRLKTIL